MNGKVKRIRREFFKQQIMNYELRNMNYEWQSQRIRREFVKQQNLNSCIASQTAELSWGSGPLPSKRL